MAVTIERYTGSHRDLEWSFREADDSPSLVDAYIDRGHLWVARGGGGDVVGHVHAVPQQEAWEITNTAVVQAQRGRDLGRRLVQRVVDEATAEGVMRLVLATGAADTGSLRFYQRCGFRMTHVVPDVFTPSNGYPPGLEVDGIALLDQVWFVRVL